MQDQLKEILQTCFVQCNSYLCHGGVYIYSSQLQIQFLILTPGYISKDSEDIAHCIIVESFTRKQCKRKIGTSSLLTEHFLHLLSLTRTWCAPEKLSYLLTDPSNGKIFFPFYPTPPHKLCYYPSLYVKRPKAVIETISFFFFKADETLEHYSFTFYYKQSSIETCGSPKFLSCLSCLHLHKEL